MANWLWYNELPVVRYTIHIEPASVTMGYRQIPHVKKPYNSMRPGSVGSGAGTVGSDGVQYKAHRGPVRFSVSDPFFTFVATIDIRLL